MIPARFAAVLFPLVMTFFMAGVVSLLLTVVNLGMPRRLPAAVAGELGAGLALRLPRGDAGDPGRAPHRRLADRGTRRLTPGPAPRAGGPLRPPVSAIRAPRAPRGCSGPAVVSRAVWCSISASSSAPTSTTVAESQVQVMKPTTAPSEP